MPFVGGQLDVADLPATVLPELGEHESIEFVGESWICDAIWQHDTGGVPQEHEYPVHSPVCADEPIAGAL